MSEVIIHRAKTANGGQTTFESVTCGRCGGSGRFSYCSAYGDRCFGCGGTGVKLTKRGAAASQFFQDLLTSSAADFKVGDKLLYEGVPGFIPSFWATVQEIGTEDGKLVFRCTSAKHGGYVTYHQPEERVRVARTAEFKRDAVARAREYELTLTKAGNPRKRAEAVTA